MENKVLKDILVKWDDMVHNIDTDAAHSIDLTNPYHFVLLERAMNSLNLPSWFDKKSLMREIRVDEKFFADLVEEENKKLTKGELRNKLAAADPGLESQGTVVTKIYGDLSNDQFIKVIKNEFNVKTVKMYEPKTGPNNSSTPLFTWKDGDFDYEINLSKTSVTGRGASQTKDQELSWLLVLSAMQYGGDPKKKDEFISLMISNPEVYNLIDGVNQNLAFQLGAFLENNSSWYDSHVAQCKKMISTLGATNQPKRYVKDSSSLQVNKQAASLYKAEHGSKLDLDKWNPADVWLEYSKVPQFKTLAELNNWLIDSLHRGKGYIGVSLKKGGGSVGLVNDYKRKSYQLKGLNAKFGYLFSQGVEFTYKGENLDGLGLAFRIFQGKPTETIRGEGTSKGAEAVQGKVALHVINSFKSGIVSKVESVKGVSVQLVQDPNSKNKKDKLWGWTSNGLARFKKAQAAYKKVKGASFDDTTTHGKWGEAFSNPDKFLKVLNAWAPPPPDKTNKQENSIIANISARFQSLIFGSIIMSLSISDQQKIMVGMLKYGKSQSDWSSAHYKAQ